MLSRSCCRDCRHWKQDVNYYKGERGECRVNPPTEKDRYFHFVATPHDLWCGHVDDMRYNMDLYGDELAERYKHIGMKLLEGKST